MQYYADVDFSRFARIAGTGKYCNLAAAFDIETTCIRYPNDYDDRTKAGQPKFSFMYIWQFAIGDIAVYGRTWNEFYEFLLNLRGDLHLKVDHRLVVYVHELAYEFTFMQKLPGVFFSTYDYDFLAREKHDIIKCVVNDVFEFRDSATYTEMPLSRVGDLVGIKKLDYDYDKLRLPSTPLTDTELAYCENDVLILTKYFSGQAQIYGSYGNIPLTATRCVKREIEINLRTMYYRGVARKSQTIEEEDMHTLDLLQSAYFAPWIYNRSVYRDMIVDDVMDADISSAYPYWMLTCKYPRGKFVQIDIDHNDINKLLSDYANKPLLIKLHLHNLQCRYPRVSWLPASDRWTMSRDAKIYDNRIDSCTDIILTLTDVDMRTLQDFYRYDVEKVDILEVYAAPKYGYLPPYIVKTIVDKYIEKRNAKDIKNEIEKTRELTPAEQAEYARIKSKVDRIYGIFVQRPIRTAYLWDPGTNQVIAGDQQYVKSDSDCAVSFAWGVWLLSYEHAEMLKIFAACNLAISADGKEKNLDSVLYGDTDGVKFKYNKAIIDIITQYNEKCKQKIKNFWLRNNNICRLEDVDGMGEFKFKHYQSFKACKVKRYAYISDNDEFVPVCAGLSADNTFFDGLMNDEKMELFSGEMKISAEVANNKRTQYVYGHFEECVTDYLGNTDTVSVDSCVLISKCSFNFVDDESSIDRDTLNAAFDRKPTISRPKRGNKNATKKNKK